MNQNELKEIFQHEANAIADIPVSDQYGRAIDTIYLHIHLNRGKLVCSGMGKAGQIAQNIATTFCSTGTPAVFLHPSDAQHGDLGVLSPNDVLLLVSNSGKTREILELVQLADKLHTGLPTIVITGDLSSELALSCDIILSTGHPKEVCPLGLTPGTSTTVMTVIGDALVTGMIRKIGFTRADYAKRHHGGYLGEIART